MELVGVGGCRMVSAGLEVLLDFNDLPVSGFWDVLPRFFRLKKNYRILETSLKNPLCKGLVAIDYPGFNMKLVTLANKLKKPVLYIAPPQAWAWKAKRARKLANPQNRLAYFFDFEAKPYERACCNIVKMQHPLATAADSISLGKRSTSKKSVLLLPGSRLGQAFRNLNLFLDCAQRLRDEISCLSSLAELPDVVILASRESSLGAFQKKLNRKFHNEVPSWIRVEVSPRNAVERMSYYKTATMVLTTPGTSTLELALSGSRCVVCTCPDKLTYLLGKCLIKTSWFSLPSIMLGKKIYPEYILWNRGAKSVRKVANALLESAQVSMKDSDVLALRKKVDAGKNSDELMSEFLAQFL